MPFGLRGAMLLVALLVAVSSTVTAQQPGKLSYGFAGGLLLPIGDFGGLDQPGWVVGGGGTYWLRGGKLGVRGDVSYGQTAHDTSGGSTKIAGGMASLVYAPGSGATVHPYVIGGLGYYRVDVGVTGFGSASESKVGFALGAGVTLARGPAGSRLFVETRFTSVSTSGFSTTFLPMVVGLRFGR